MTDLVLHGRPIATVFDLLGHDENDMTASLGWALARSETLMRSFVGRVAPGTTLGDDAVIELQEHDRADGGFTDIEVKAPGRLHIIVEAKRGWGLPSEGQLRRYEARFAFVGAPAGRFVVLTQNGAEEVVRHRLAGWSPPEPIVPVVLSWADLADLARAASRRGPIAERHLAADLDTYLRGVADMRDTNSNAVFVVSLTRNTWAGWPLTPVDEVERHRIYHFPTVGAYPKIVPNYMAFRYDGKLQSIHHVDDYTIVDSPEGQFPGAPALTWDSPAYFLRLGPPIRPDHEVRTGSAIRRSARVWVDVDLLLTSATISEALTVTKARRAP